MTRPAFADTHQEGSYWTGEERAKGVYIAKRAIRRGCDALGAVRAYMGMDHANAAICVKRAKVQLSMTDRRTVHHV